MPELRRDPLTDRWVIIAEERHSRPGNDYVREVPQPLDPSQDPFAEGNEHHTSPEIYAVRAPGTLPDTPGWRVRVVANKYPATQPDGKLVPDGDPLFQRSDSVGAHEVVIETPDPEAHLKDLPLDHIVDILRTYQVRIAELYHNPLIAHALVFKNHGYASGATLAHPHSQIVALSNLPARIKTVVGLREAGLDYWRRRLFQDLLKGELAAGERIVFDNGSMVVFCPFASRFPYELTIMPRRVAADFETATDPELYALADALRTGLRKWHALLGPTPYNYVLYTAPNMRAELIAEEYPLGTESYCWHMSLFPRLQRFGGMELGGDCFINTVAPERAAAELRAAGGAL